MCVDTGKQEEMAADTQRRYENERPQSYYRPKQFDGVIAGVAEQGRDESGPLGSTTRGIDIARSPLGTNPKDLLGAKKVSISKLPFIGVIHGAHAMMDGARKYGPYNWRSNKVVAGIYIDALVRHAAAWFDGEENATDSGVNHLGHVIACASILLDAQETGNLVDDRPIAGATGTVLDRLNTQIKAREDARIERKKHAAYEHTSPAISGRFGRIG